MNKKFIANIYSKLMEDISEAYIYTEPIAFKKNIDIAQNSGIKVW